MCHYVYFTKRTSGMFEKISRFINSIKCWISIFFLYRNIFIFKMNEEGKFIVADMQKVLEKFPEVEKQKEILNTINECIQQGTYIKLHT